MPRYRLEKFIFTVWNDIVNFLALYHGKIEVEHPLVVEVSTVIV